MLKASQAVRRAKNNSPSAILFSMGGLQIGLVVKTPLGLENLVASRIEELSIPCRVHPKPSGYLGLVLVEVDEKAKHKLAERIRGEVPEAERVLVTEECVVSDLEAIREAALRVSVGVIDAETPFAVRTVRRGSQSYRSVDVNRVVGQAIVDEIGAPVSLDNPEKVLWVEIIDDEAALGVIDGAELWRKMAPGKLPLNRYFGRLSVVQMPYLGQPEVVRAMGSRIGRAVQMFEVGEIVVAITGDVGGRELSAFLGGLEEGIASRYRVQRRTYAHKPKRVGVLVEDLYQLVRDRRGEPKIIFEPEGRPFPEVEGEIVAKILSKVERVNLLFGSREGIPKGVYRFADLIVDLCPGITLSTEYAASSALIGIAYALERRLRKGESEEAL
jgi:tRNA acetyltransferase TAN1